MAERNRLFRELLLFWLWWTACGLVILVWIARAVILAKIRMDQPILGSQSYDGPPHSTPKVSVLVAAKDEADNIEACLRSLLRQDYPAFELIAIDDRSTDDTGLIMRRVVREHPSALTVLTVDRLPEGWGGKNHAMHQGVNRATGEWLCFIDADCRQTSTRTLSMALREAFEHQADFLSILPVLETRTFWERVLQPVCAAVMAFWFQPSRVNNPKTKTAYSNGAFMLMRRSTYDAIGGHEGVRAELNEDIQLARLAKSGGWRLRVIQGDDLFVSRMYDSFQGCWQGWSRIFHGSFRTYPRLFAAFGMLSLFSVFPWISLGMALAGAAFVRENSSYMTSLTLTLGMMAAMYAALLQFYPMVRARRIWTVSFPLGAMVCWGMFLNAVLQKAGAMPTTWRGTTYTHRRTPRLQPIPSTDPVTDAV